MRSKRAVTPQSCPTPRFVNIENPAQLVPMEVGCFVGR